MASSKLACHCKVLDEDRIQKLIIQMENLAFEMKQMKQDHKKEMDELLSMHKKEIETIVASKNVLENQAWYKVAWNQFKEMSGVKKALVVLILGLIIAGTIWATATIAIWAFPYVVSFVITTYTYLVELFSSAANYLMSCPWFAEVVTRGPAFLVEHGTEIAEVAGLGGGVAGIILMFVKHVKTSKSHKD